VTGVEIATSVGQPTSCVSELGKENLSVSLLTCEGKGKSKGKGIPGQALSGLQKVKVPTFHGSWPMKMVRLSALRTGHLYTQEIFLVLISVRG